MGADVIQLPDPIATIVQALVIIMQFSSAIIYIYESDASELKATGMLSPEQQDDMEDYAHSIKTGQRIRCGALAMALLLIAARICGYI